MGQAATRQPQPKTISTIQVQPSRPNQCSYWVTENLMAGEYPGHHSNDPVKTRTRLRKYLNAGITFFVDLTQPGEKPNYERMLYEEQQKLLIGKKKAVHQRFAILDMGVTDQQKMTKILDAIDGAIEDGHKVYVHCLAGIGRTGTVVGCYLVRHGKTGQEALAEVSRLFQLSGRRSECPISPETLEQIRFVMDWKE